MLNLGSVKDNLERNFMRSPNSTSRLFFRLYANNV